MEPKINFCEKNQGNKTERFNKITKPYENYPGHSFLIDIKQFRMAERKFKINIILVDQSFQGIKRMQQKCGFFHETIDI